MSPETIKLIVSAAATALVSALATGGFVVTQDVTNARNFVEEQAEELARVKSLEDEVVALRAQQELMLGLIERRCRR